MVGMRNKFLTLVLPFLSLLASGSTGQAATQDTPSQYALVALRNVTTDTVSYSYWWGHSSWDEGGKDKAKEITLEPGHWYYHWWKYPPQQEGHSPAFFVRFNRAAKGKADIAPLFKEQSLSKAQAQEKGYRYAKEYVFNWASDGRLDLHESPTDQPVARPAEDNLSQQIYAKMLRAAGFVWTPTHHGSAWLVDRSERLMITNHHVVAPKGKVLDTVEVLFPDFQDGKIIPESSHYLDDNFKPRTHSYRARVIDNDPGRDLALIALDSMPEGEEELPLAADSPKAGDRLHYCGNPRIQLTQSLWTYTQGIVRQVARHRNAWPDQVVDCVQIDTQSPTNPGDSGGAVVNDRGLVVGVNSSGYSGAEANLLSFCIDIREVRTFLGQARQYLHPREISDFRNRGINYQKKGRYELAVNDLTKVIEEVPRDDVALHNRGQAYNGLGQFDRAIADFTEALQIKEYSAGYQNRGVSYFRKKDHTQAIADLDEAIRLRPSNGWAYHYRGMAWAHHGNHQQAVTDLTRAIQFLPDDTIAYGYRGDSYYTLGQYDDAIKSYDEALRRDPYWAGIWFYRGMAYNVKKNYVQAFADATKAIELSPQFADYYHWRGIFRHNYIKENDGKGDYRLSVADATKAIELAPGSAIYYGWRAEYHYLLDQLPEALQDANTAIALDRRLAQGYVARAHIYLKLAQISINRKATSAANRYLNLAEADEKKARELLGDGKPASSRKKHKKSSSRSRQR